MDGVLTLIGGVGLFLFGMQTMTSALRQLGGSGLRRVLARFTTSPASGAAVGAAATAVLQSSSATTVATIGLVGAGLLTFPQALGIILGANVGTTVTGWMVVLLGFKLDLGVAALPLLFAASLASVLGRGRIARLGLAVAGFALIFLGIDFLRSGAEAWSAILTPDRLPADTWLGRAAMLAVGVVVTTVIQSSSAGVAITLALLSGGSISFLQAAAMVIGMDIGTTLKAVAAGVGGSRAMRRTGLAHVVYNLMTGLFAFGAMGWLAPFLRDGVAGGDAEAGLVAFHTVFNLIGVVAVLPFTGLFVRLLEWLVPDQGAPIEDRLDRRLLADPGAALDAATTTAGDIARAIFGVLVALLRPGADRSAEDETLARVDLALDALHDFLARIPVPEDAIALIARYSALLHTEDHLRRLLHRARQSDRARAVPHDAAMRRSGAVLAAELEQTAPELGAEKGAQRLARLSHLLQARIARHRRATLLREHLGTVAPRDLFKLTDAMRWLDRIAAHAERIAHYLAQAAPVVGRSRRETPGPDKITGSRPEP